MIKRRKIAGAFMMLIMLVMMAHNTFPHIHHQHKSHCHYAHDNAHHSHQGEDHRHENKNTSAHNPFDFISFLLGNHAHSQQVVDNTLIVVQDLKEKSQKKIAKIFFEKADSKNLLVDTVLSKKSSIYFLREISNFYYTSSPLRGPPTLG